MTQTVGEGTCMFCNINRKINPVDLGENDTCRIFENAWPYPGHAWHLVLATKLHWTELSHVTNQGAIELMQLAVQMVKQYEIPGGAHVLRFGDHDYNAGTLRHLHFQTQGPNLLQHAFVTLGKPNEMQTEEAVAMLEGSLVHKPDFQDFHDRAYWYVRKDHNPRPHVKMQFEVQLKHGADLRLDFPPAAIELFDTLRDLERESGMPGGAFVTKFGDPRYHGYYSPVHSRHPIGWVVFPDNTGPVFETLVLPKNRGQIMRFIDKLYKK
ncbi:hypothetical protein KW782_02280 [Candidatus Parcubacteria bacterium]|nr:hypothetical protein [Candidatus Parcubacteria bacterium]